MAKMANWQLLCAGLEGEGQTHAKIFLKLHNGLTVSGEISISDAKQIFREPHDLSPIDRQATVGEVQVVLPISKVDRVAFPFAE